MSSLLNSLAVSVILTLYSISTRDGKVRAQILSQKAALPHLPVKYYDCLSLRVPHELTGYRNASEYMWDTCATCYNFMHEKAFGGNRDIALRYVAKRGQIAFLEERNTSARFYPDPYKLNERDRTSHPVLKTFVIEDLMRLFIKCCVDASKCCDRQLKAKRSDSQKASTGSVPMCPMKWDGWSCWDPAPPESMSEQKCPLYAIQMEFATFGFIPECRRSNSYKACTGEGRWFNDSTGEYTIYSTCNTLGDYNLPLTYTTAAMNAVSLVSCIISVLIYVVYRQYTVVRIQIHMNFFGALIFSNLSNIAFELAIKAHYLTGENLIAESPMWCIAIGFLYKFSRLTTYCWMLCEGLYLHQLIVAAFHEQYTTIHFYLIGWSVPCLVIIPYTIVRAIEPEQSCWTDTIGSKEWLYNSIFVVLLVVNTLLLLNVVRVLLIKLRTTPDHFRAALRATIILTPIFGLQYICYIWPVRVRNSCEDSLVVGAFLKEIIDALQGFFVALSFCFFNGEVHENIKRTIVTHFRRRTVTVIPEQDAEQMTQLREFVT